MYQQVKIESNQIEDQKMEKKRLRLIAHGSQHPATRITKTGIEAT
jgi:hypothetical protein